MIKKRVIMLFWGFLFCIFRFLFPVFIAELELKIFSVCFPNYFCCPIMSINPMTSYF